MDDIVHENPKTAWTYLCDHGGVELKGRDAGLDYYIHQRINPGAASLDEALDGAVMEDFTRAFFEAIHPYVEIFKDILRFFENAKATLGQDRWILRVDDLSLDLEHFRLWLTKWEEVDITAIQVPAIDEKGIWSLFNVLRSRDEVCKVFQKDSLDLPADVCAWVDAYSQNRYLPLPESLLAPKCPNELLVIGSIIQAALHRILSLDHTPSSLKDLYLSPQNIKDKADALNIWTIAQSETDGWIKSFIISLSASSTHMSTSDLQTLGKDLAAITSRYPTKPFDANVSVSDLESLLSLPIWKKRYELYSVWIATEIVRSLEGHNIELHHDEGCIAFPFRETLIATIHSSPGPFTLVSERRSPLDNPRGKGRKAGVQPDHTLWTRSNGVEVCRMVVEVKHYKNSAKTKFVDVFEDYARALPDGEMYLVNYGPTGNAVHEVSEHLKNRCHAIEHLTPMNVQKREEFAIAIQRCVGKPIISWPAESVIGESNSALVFDVSGSMMSMLRSESMYAFVRQLATDVLPLKIVAVDTDIIGSWEANEAGYTELLKIYGGNTGLGEPIKKLLENHSLIVVVTDSDGLASINGLKSYTHEAQQLAPYGIEVVCVRS